MHRTGKPLSELRRVLVKFPQKSGGVRVAEKKPLESCDALIREIKSVEAELGDQGRVLVRFSGTEAKLRVLVEGPDDETINAGYERLLAAAAHDLELL